MSTYNGINEVLQKEDARLETKKKSIDYAKDSKNRLISMNDNYSKRMQEYTKIIIVVIVSLLLFLGILLLKKKFPSAPDGLFTVIAIIILSVGLIYSYKIYIKIMSRDPNNFDEINPESPVVLSQAEIDKALAASIANGDLTGSLSLGQCVGPNCCDSSGTIWNVTQQKCIPAATTSQAFTTLAQAIGEYSNKKAGIISPNTKAYDEWEYTEYMKI
jgi:hypothetical protein